MATATAAPVAPLARSLPVAKTTVAIPAFHQLGHTVDEAIAVTKNGRPFDIRAFPDVLDALRTDDHSSIPSQRPHPVGVWQTDLVRYDHADAADIWTWLARKFPLYSTGSISAWMRQALYAKLAKPVEIIERMISANVLTDYGVKAMELVIAYQAQAQFFNHLQLATGAVTAQISGATANLSAAMGSTGVTAIPVVSGGTSFTSGMVIGLGVGTANEEQLTVGTGSTSTSIVVGATTKTHSQGDLVAQSVAVGVTAIPVVSGGASFTNTMPFTAGYGTANAESLTAGSGSTGTSVVTGATAHLHWAGDWLVQNPTTSDNPSSVANPYDSGALTSGAYTYSGSGAGNRQVAVAYNFPANSGAPSPGYTDLWIASAGTITSNTTAAHLTRNPLAVNSTTGANVTVTESA